MFTLSSRPTSTAEPPPTPTDPRRAARQRTALMNAVPLLVLTTPLIHRLMSRRYLVLRFTGRVSGRRYTLPVAYVADGGRLVVSTDSQWWRNIAAGQPTQVCHRGLWLPATALG